MIIMVDDNSDTVSILGMSWDQVFFLDAILIKTSFEAKSKELKRHSDELLEGLEAAENCIAQGTETKTIQTDRFKDI